MLNYILLVGCLIGCAVAVHEGMYGLAVWNGGAFLMLLVGIAVGVFLGDDPQ
jgi:hypothetical protein